MTREEVLELINDALLDAHSQCVEVTEEDKLIDSNIDSYGLIMFSLEMESQFGIYTDVELKTIDFKEITVKDVIDRILDASN